jgi:hypothetical protein
VRPDAPWRTPQGLEFLMSLAAVALATRLVWPSFEDGRLPNVCGNLLG